MRERKRTDFVVIVRATRTSNHAAALRRSFQPDRARRPALPDGGARLREALKRRYVRSPMAMHCRRVRGDQAGNCEPLGNAQPLRLHAEDIVQRRMMHGPRDARAPARLGRAHGRERVAEAVHTRNALLHRASGFQRATEIRALPLLAARAGLRASAPSPPSVGAARVWPRPALSPACLSAPRSSVCFKSSASTTENERHEGSSVRPEAESPFLSG